MSGNEVFKVSIFRSHYKAAKKLPAEERLAFLEAMLDYQFEGETEESLPIAVDCLMTAIRPVLDKEIECRQGRPECDITAEEIAAKKEELGSAKAVADFYGISERTVYNKLQTAKTAKSPFCSDCKKLQTARTAKTKEERRMKNEECRKENEERENVEGVNEEREKDKQAEKQEEREGAQSAPVELQAAPALLGSENLSQNSVLFPTEQAADSPQQAEQSQEKQKQQKNAAFVAPSVEEVAAYCKERDNGIDAEAFVAFYASKGWMVGKNKMKDWRQAVITWEKRAREQAAGQYSARASPEPVAVQRENSGWHSVHTVF